VVISKLHNFIFYAEHTHTHHSVMLWTFIVWIKHSSNYIHLCSTEERKAIWNDMRVSMT